jgi:hypothetical protein
MAELSKLQVPSFDDTQISRDAKLKLTKIPLGGIWMLRFPRGSSETPVIPSSRDRKQIVRQLEYRWEAQYDSLMTSQHQREGLGHG